MKTLPFVSQIIKPMIFALAFSISIGACKKDKADEPEPEEETPVTPANGTRAQLTKDSIFLYAKEVYLWNDALPTYQAFNPRKFTQYSEEVDNYNAELFAITQFKINPATGKPYEFVSATANYPKYSYITDKTSNNPSTSSVFPSVSQVTLEGVGSDFGIALTAVGSTSAYQIYIRYVSPGSPADKNFLNRGDVLTQVNGTTLGGNFASDQNTINNAFDQPSIRLTGRKANGSAFNRTLTKMTYNSSPVYKDTVITVSGKKIGYVALARFSNPANALAPLNASFAKFASNGVTHLVVDLRYNGGGYVSTAEYLANLIAPPSVNGNVMFTEYYNSTMQDGNAIILKNQPLLNSRGNLQYSNGKLITYFDVDYSVAENTYRFQKRGSLSTVTHVAFIVTGSTASASELTINVLKPYLNVKLVGSTTYGKPVGFFPITIDKYDVYYSMFESKNSRGEGGYYQGIAPDSQASDDVTRDFGNPSEVSFAAAINYLVSGSLIASTKPTVKILGKSVILSSSVINDIGKDDSFKGMIETAERLKLKK